jgi:hypothetical protein
VRANVNVSVCAHISVCNCREQHARRALHTRCGKMNRCSNSCALTQQIQNSNSNKPQASQSARRWTHSQIQTDTRARKPDKHERLVDVQMRKLLGCRVGIVGVAHEPPQPHDPLWWRCHTVPRHSRRATRRTAHTVGPPGLCHGNKVSSVEPLNPESSKRAGRGVRPPRKHSHARVRHQPPSASSDKKRSRCRRLVGGREHRAPSASATATAKASEATVCKQQKWNTSELLCGRFLHLRNATPRARVRARARACVRVWGCVWMSKRLGVSRES